MPNSQKPTITPEHHERFAQIMQTPTRPNTPKIADSTQPSKVSALLASLPKPKGIGNKMFVFTGKKKIVLEAGGKQEVETVKTVDAPALKTPDSTKHTENTKPEENSKSAEAKKPEDKKDKKEGAKKSGGAKAFLVIALIVFLGAWALFWLYFLEFI